MKDIIVNWVKEDEELLKANFTREEIEDGLKDFKKIFKAMNK